MKVVKDSEYGILLYPFAIGDQYNLTLSVLLCFDLMSPTRLLTEQEMWQSVGRALGEDAMLDQGMPKPGGEFLVAGSCFSPEGAPRRASYVKCRVGTLEKTLNVFGDRYWAGAGGALSGISDPEPFSEIPVVWENAFGGPGYRRNPLGKGAGEAEGLDGKKAFPLPNIEDPRKTIGARSDRPDPAGFLPYPIDWPQRTRKLGTYGDRWLRERWPYYAEDMDHTYFNGAPPDQQSREYFEGDEEIEILNMHPAESIIRSRLPGVRARCFVTVAGDGNAGGETFREVSMKPDTVWLLPSELRGIVVFRGTTPVKDDEYEDVLRAFVAAESLSESPKDLHHYLEEEKRKMAFETAADGFPVEEHQREIDDAMKQVASIPRLMQESLDRALGKAPPLPPSRVDSVSAARNAADRGTKALAEMERSLLELKARYGHIMKIDTSPLADAGEKLAAMPAEIAGAAGRAAEAVKQTDGLKEGTIASIRKGLSPEALGKRGFPMDVLEEKGVFEAADFPEESKDPWLERAGAFLEDCTAGLNGSPDRLKSLLDLGLTEDICDLAWLGYNPAELTEDPAAWGLGGGDARVPVEMIAVPAGFVIPHFNGPHVDRIIVRPGPVTDCSMDVVVPGSKENLPVIGPPEEKPVVIVEDELAAWLVYQEAWDLCSCAAVRDLDFNKVADGDLKKRLESSPWVLVSVPAQDEPGSKPDASGWLSAFSNASAVPVPEGESVLDAHRLGWDVRAWILASLPRTAVPDKVLQHEEKRKQGIRTPDMNMTEMTDAFKKEMNASIAGDLEKAEALKRQMLAEARDVLEKHNIDPAAVFTAEADPLTGATILSLDMGPDLIKVKERLKEMGRLTPELEKEIDQVRSESRKLLQDAALRHDEGIAKAADAEAFSREPLPEWARDQFKSAGIDPDLDTPPLTAAGVTERLQRGESLEGLDLSGLDLSGLDLQGIVLAGAILEGTRFSGADLEGADLSRALCTEADFTGASLRSSVMTGGLFTKARFNGADLYGIDGGQALLNEADLTGVSLDEARLQDAVFEKTLLSGAGFRRASLKSATFIQARADGTDFTDADLSGATFLETAIKGADFSGSSARNVTFWQVDAAGCKFSRGDLKGLQVGGGSDLRNGEFDEALLEGANMTDSCLSKSSFRQSRLDRAIIENCDLSGCNLYRASAKEARFNKSGLEGADMRGVNLFKGSLRKARLTDTDIRGSNLYGVEFFKAVLGNTRTEGSNLKRTVLYGTEDFFR